MYLFLEINCALSPVPPHPRFSILLVSERGIVKNTYTICDVDASEHIIYEQYKVDSSMKAHSLRAQSSAASHQHCTGATKVLYRTFQWHTSCQRCAKGTEHAGHGMFHVEQDRDGGGW